MLTRAAICFLKSINLDVNLLLYVLIVSRFTGLGRFQAILFNVTIN